MLFLSESNPHYAFSKNQKQTNKTQNVKHKKDERKIIMYAYATSFCEGLNIASPLLIVAFMHKNVCKTSWPGSSCVSGQGHTFRGQR